MSSSCTAPAVCTFPNPAAKPSMHKVIKWTGDAPEELSCFVEGQTGRACASFPHFTDGKTEDRSNSLASSASCHALVQLYTELGQNAAGCDWEGVVDQAVLGGANQSGGNSDGQPWSFWLAAARLGSVPEAGSACGQEAYGERCIAVTVVSLQLVLLQLTMVRVHYALTSAVHHSLACHPCTLVTFG